jgi:hypothetical protein
VFDPEFSGAALGFVPGGPFSAQRGRAKWPTIRAPIAIKIAIEPFRQSVTSIQ